MYRTVTVASKAVGYGAYSQIRGIQQPTFTITRTVDLVKHFIAPSQTSGKRYRTCAPAFIDNTGEQQFGEILLENTLLLLLFIQNPVFCCLICVADTEGVERDALLRIHRTDR